MSHGSQCSCGLCTIGKKMGMIKPAQDTSKKCACNSGKESKECCNKE